MLILLCVYPVDLTLTTIFHNLPLISNSIAACISNVTVYIFISNIIVNLDQTPLSYVSPGKDTFDVKSVKTVPIKGTDNKRHITATFAFSMPREFLPIQVVYEGKTTRYIYLSTLFLRIST